MTAGNLYSVAVDRRARRPRSRAVRWVVRLLGGLILEGEDPGMPDLSPVVYRVPVRERSSGRIVHVEDCGGDEAAARDGYRRLARELAEMDPEAFRARYGI